MFKGHPKGLFVLALTNMGERFGYYTMLAIFTLYLQAKFGLDSGLTGQIFGGFLAAVYFLPLLGGIIADKFLGYGKTIFFGVIIMFAGYALLATPSEPNSTGYIMMFTALFLISLGTGFFKGNLQALVGNLYDDSKYAVKRDLAFSIFYMFINIGAFFAPSAAEAVSNAFLAKENFKYEAEIPDKALKFNNYKVMDENEFKALVIKEENLSGKTEIKINKAISKAKNKRGIIYTAEKEKYRLRLDSLGRDQMGDKYVSVEDFSKKYITSLSKSYNWGFGVACISLIISILIFLGFRKTYKSADLSEAQKAKDINKKNEVIELTPQQTKARLVALGLVFLVVIFFWMSFHQNGLTMTFFARDYTNLQITPLQNIGFSLLSLLPFIIGFYGIISFFQSKNPKAKIISSFVALGGAILIVLYYNSMKADSYTVTPPKFQQFNPFFIILLTPIFISLFSWLNKKGIEPSAPKKIGIGMGIAAIGFIPLILGSIGLKSPETLMGGVSDSLVTPNYLISTYFILTIAELFLSPMGISFVSKVAPPKYKGLMQGGWLAATAGGNYLVGVIGGFWDSLPLITFWSVLVICCFISAIFIFSIMKRLENATGTPKTE
jgi:proton-dependent oligopeptide transporter, POT family